MVTNTSNQKLQEILCTFRDGCKGTSKLNLETNLITSIHSHNHNVEKYKTEVYELKSKCKTMARKSQTSLRRVFDDVTRHDPCASDVSFNECESSPIEQDENYTQKFHYQLLSLWRCCQQQHWGNTISIA